MIEKALLDSLLAYAKALTNARSFADYYAELAVGEFLDHGGSFSDPECARHRLYEAFHRVWRGAQASELRNGGKLNGGGEAEAEEPDRAGLNGAAPLRQAARLLATREGFSPTEVAGILNRPVRVVEEWLLSDGIPIRSARPLPVEVTRLAEGLARASFTEGVARAAPDRAAPGLLPPGEIRVRPGQAAGAGGLPPPSRQPATVR